MKKTSSPVLTAPERRHFLKLSASTGFPGAAPAATVMPVEALSFRK